MHHLAAPPLYTADINWLQAIARHLRKQATHRLYQFIDFSRHLFGYFMNFFNILFTFSLHTRYVHLHLLVKVLFGQKHCLLLVNIVSQLLEGLVESQLEGTHRQPPVLLQHHFPLLLHPIVILLCSRRQSVQLGEDALSQLVDGVEGAGPFGLDRVLEPVHIALDCLVRAHVV